MGQIRNFYLASQETPLLGIITKSQLLIMGISGFLPGLFFIYSFKVINSLPLTIISGILLFACVCLGFIITSVTIDGRTVLKYGLDRRRPKSKYIPSGRYKIEKENIESIIESITK